MLFDYSQRGEVSTHRYRGYYDAGEGSATRCGQCNRVIRYCYSLHDKNLKSFVIGTCCFLNYSGKTLIQLQAASILQKATVTAVKQDTTYYGTLTLVKDRRKQWSQAKRRAAKLVKDYQKRNGDWLPKELFDLSLHVQKKLPKYKKPALALRWLEKETAALSQEISI